MFYLSGTVDNLTARSSTVQLLCSDPTPGDRPELVKSNMQIYQQLGRQVAGHS